MIIDFVNEISNRMKIAKKDLIEKDIILHQILTDLSNDEFFSKNFIFKGGTCLVKAYLGYYRFSEDVDFTWKDQKIFEKMSGKQISKHLSGVIDETGSIFEKIAKARDLDFQCKKDNRNYVELGGSNKMCTFKVWYNSEVLGMKSFLKVQINFVEILCLDHTKNGLKSLAEKQDSELEFLFPEYKDYLKTIDFETYELREILCEKIRAILTRKGSKARDFVDVYLINKRNGIKLDDMEDCIQKKIKFSLEHYEKYKENLKQKIIQLESGEFFDWGKEKELLLEDIDEKEFYKFLKEILKPFLKKIIKPYSNL